MINSYSYTPTMLNENNNIKEFSNDDMYIELSKERNYNYYLFYVYACSYDGQLEVSEVFRDQETAEKLYNYIYESYTDTPPGDELQSFINSLT